MQQLTTTQQKIPHIISAATISWILSRPVISLRVSSIFWRSFLSFGAVVPAGAHALLPWLADQLPWFERVAEETDKLTLPAHVLRTWGLVRREPTFVGARGLED